MLGSYPILANIPVTDLRRAKEFYSNVLGLAVDNSSVIGVAMLSAGENTRVMLYERAPVNCDHTHASFVVPDILAAMNELKSKGVAFEQYDMGNGFKTDENGVMTVGLSKTAWFKDSEGNILALNQKMQ